MTKTNIPKPEDYKEWTEVVGAEADNVAFQALVETAQDDSEAWHRQYHGTC